MFCQCADHVSGGTVPGMSCSTHPHAQRDFCASLSQRLGDAPSKTLSCEANRLHDQLIGQNWSALLAVALHKQAARLVLVAVLADVHQGSLFTWSSATPAMNTLFPAGGEGT